jgi:hypothetical protein
MKSNNFEKFVVGYFSLIGITLLFGIGVPQLLGIFFLNPNSTSEQIMAVSRFASGIAQLFPLAYLYLLYRIWGNGRLVLKLGITFYLSYFLLGIVFAFTFPVWIIFGILCLIYGIVRGLFKKEQQVSQTAPVSTGQPKPTLKRNLIITGGVVIVLYILFHIAFYGFQLGSCEYTDEVVATPPELIGATIVVEKDQYLGRGYDSNNCASPLKEITNQVISSESINNVTIGRRYFEDRGLTVDFLKKGKKFQLVEIIAQTKHGLGTIDSGSGPIYFLILRDENGDLYQAATVDLSFDEKESSFAAYKNGSKVVNISWRYFEEFYSK